MYELQMNSPVGVLCLTSDGENLTGCYFKETKKKDEIPLLLEAKKQLEEYFKGERREFSLPLKVDGTEFRKKVWNALLEIPYGSTCSYKELAEAVNNPKAVRAVGGANHNNPISIIIPCHRVIGADGSLTGYGGGLEVKKYLLELEEKN